MRLNFRIATIFLVFLLVIINVCLFTQTLFLGENILKLEKDINKLRLENSRLEKRLFSLTSIQNLKKQAQLLGFTEESEPVYLENLKYALR